MSEIIANYFVNSERDGNVSLSVTTKPEDFRALLRGAGHDVSDAHISIIDKTGTRVGGHIDLRNLEPGDNVFFDTETDNFVAKPTEYQGDDESPREIREEQCDVSECPAPFKCLLDAVGCMITSVTKNGNTYTIKFK